MIRFGVYSADLSSRRLYKHGLKVRLQEQPFRVLVMLLKNPGEVVTREELHAQLWPNDTFVAFDEGLNATVNRLRRALGDRADNPRFVETVPKQGYRFIGSVILPEAPDPLTHNAITENATLQPRARRTALLLGAYGRPATIALLVLLSVGVALGYRFTRNKVQAEKRELASQECVKGRALWRNRNAESLVKAIDQYDKAVAIDASFAPAYSGLADAYIVLPMLSTVSQQDTYPKARAAAEKAIALAPTSAEAHTSAADVKLYVDWDFTGAEREFQSALQLDPMYATAHQWYAEYLSLEGRHDEAIKEILRAQQLQPLSAVMYHQSGQIYQNARQYDRAVSQYERALQLDPNFYPACSRLADALRHEGKYADAFETESEFFKRHATSFYSPGSEVASRPENELRAYKAGGEKSYWRQRLARHSQDVQDHPGSMYHLAIDYAQNGDSDNALLWLEKVYESHANDILSLKVDVELDPLRSDPRFQELVRKVGLP